MNEHEAAIAAIRQQGGTDADVEAYLRSVGAVEVTKPREPMSPARQAVGASIRADINRRERQPVGVAENLANVAEMFSDASTFGLSGLALDAINSGRSGELFRARRDARRNAREAMPTRDQLGLGIAGGVANPVGAFLGPAKASAGLLRIAGKGLLEGSLQGAAQAAGENIGTSEGMATPVAVGATVGGLFGGAVAPIAARIAGRAGRMDPIAEAAARRASEAAEADRALGHTVPALPTGPGMPRPMDIDRAGPTMTAQARGAAQTVPGREAFRVPFEARAAEMPEALSGDAPDAVALANRLRSERAAQAKVDFELAEELTKGQPIETPFLAEFQNTRAGRAAWAEVQAARPGMVLAKGDPERALPVVADEQVPDGEAIHEMTRWLRERSKTGKDQVFPDGVGSREAGIALELLEKAKAELPAPYRTAVENYARLSEPIDALEMGRRRWAVNPSPGKKADRMAVTNVRTQMTRMSPEEQSMVRTGKQFDLATRVNEGKLTPTNAVPKLDRPASTLAWEAALSGSPLPKRLRAWGDVMDRQKALVSGDGPALKSGLLGVVDEVTRGTSLLGKTATAWRILRGQLSDAARDRIGKEDEAFARLLTSDGDTEKVIRSLSARDQKVIRAAQRASAQAGKQGGLLAQ